MKMSFCVPGQAPLFSTELRNLSAAGENPDDTLKDSRGQDPSFVSTRSIMLPRTRDLTTRRPFTRPIPRSLPDAFEATPDDPRRRAPGVAGSPHEAASIVGPIVNGK